MGSVTHFHSLELPVIFSTMKGWQVGFGLTLVLGHSLGRPSHLGASQRFPLFLGQQQRQGHSLLGGEGGHHDHHHEELHEHHPGPHQLGQARALDSLYTAPLPEAQPLDALYSAPPAEVVPLDTLYGAPPPEELPSYAEEVPAPSDPVPVPAPAPMMMMMDPSYSFQFSNEDSQRSEANDINNILTGSYGYKTPGGEDILVKYKAGPDIGFVVENAEEVAAAIERTAGEAAPAVKAIPYSGEAAEVEFRSPGVDASMALENNYSYGYKVSDKAVNQEADKEGEVKGSYSYVMEDGSEIEVRYTAGKNGFVVENLEDVMAKVNAASEASEAAKDDLGQYGATPQVTDHVAPVADVDVAKAAPASDDYADYEPYVHVDIPAEPYVHVDMPYVHEEIPAEVYVHEEPDYVEAAEAAPVAAKLTPPAPSYQKKNIVRKRVQVNKHESSAASATAAAGKGFTYEAIAEDHEITESADEENERTGSYTYLTPEGDRITVRYSAGKNGFVILNPEEVLPQPVTA